MCPDTSRPVFIIGGSRTGSTMLQTILSKSPEISLTDEIQFRSPWWLHRDLVSDIKTHVDPLDKTGALDRDMLYSELSRGPLTIRSIFHSILTAHARKRQRAQFPRPLVFVNFSDYREDHGYLSSSRIQKPGLQH